MKRLPPSQRENQRYLKFRLRAEKDLDLGEVVESVWKSCIRYLGTRDSSAANFWVIGNKFNEEEQQGVIRVRADREDDLRAALATSKDVGGVEGFVEIVKVSGSLKGLE